MERKNHFIEYYFRKSEDRFREIELSPGVKIGYFHQDHRTLDFSLNPVQQIQKLRPKMSMGIYVHFWDAFNFLKRWSIPN